MPGGIEHDYLDLAVGDRVDYHAVIGGPITSRGHVVKHISVEAKGREITSALAWITGKRGCVAMEALTPAEEKTEGQKLVEFCDRMVANSEPTPPEFSKTIDEHFWELS